LAAKGAEEYAIREEVAAVKHALEKWLLPAEPFLVPVERKVSLRQWEKARRKELPTALREVVEFRECAPDCDEEGRWLDLEGQQKAESNT